MGSSSERLICRFSGTSKILKRVLRVLVTAAALAIPFLGAPTASLRAETVCSDDTVLLRGDFGEARFSVDLAVTPQERNRGLMFVDKMPSSHGMLFVYERPQNVAFWMKNTLIPLDMVFVDAQGVVQNVHVNAVPGDLTPIPGAGDIQYVLEVNGGLTKRLGIGPGAELRHPAIENANWSCD